MDDGMANATINRELSALKRMLNLGAKQTPPLVNRVPYIPMLKENNIRKGFFEHSNFLTLRDALPPYLQGFITFGYHTGWRVSEIRDLQWSQIDSNLGYARIETGDTKNDDARTVYFGEELKQIVDQQWKARKTNRILIPYVFPNRKGTGPIREFRKPWNVACRKAKLGYGYKESNEYVEEWQVAFAAGPIFHDLRRTAVRNMVRSGVQERVAMMISGHKTRSVFDRYNIVNDQDLINAAKKQEDFLNSQLLGTKPGTIHVVR